MRAIRVNMSIGQSDFGRLESVYEKAYENNEIPQSMSLTGFCTMIIMSVVSYIEEGEIEIIPPARSVIRPGRPKKVSE